MMSPPISIDCHISIPTSPQLRNHHISRPLLSLTQKKIHHLTSLRRRCSNQQHSRTARIPNKIMKRKRNDLQKDSSSVRGVPDPNRPQPDPNNDGANTQVQPRRKRGRPPGSTNKPKSPDPIMSPYILEVADGVDVIAAIATFSRRHNIFLGILFASGAFSSITTLEPPHTSFPNISYSRTTHGRLDILSLAAVFYDRRSNTWPAQVGDLNVATTVRDNYGRIIGGIVTGPLIASGIVYVIVSSFTRPTYHRLFVGDQDEDETSSGRNEQQGPSAAPGDQNNAGAVAMSNRNAPTYGIWRACN